MEKITIIPAFNEEKHIENVLKKAVKMSDYIIVIDDGSTDNTHNIISNFIRNHKNIVYLRNKKNKGKGFCIREAFYTIKKKKMSGDILIICDADEQYDLMEYNNLIKPILKEKVDYVIGSRDFSKIPFKNAIANRIWRATFNLFFGTKLRDTNCGFVAMKREIIDKIKINSKRYEIDNEMMIRALENGFKLKNVDVGVRYEN